MYIDPGHNDDPYITTYFVKGGGPLPVDWVELKGFRNCKLEFVLLIYYPSSNDPHLLTSNRILSDRSVANRVRHMDRISSLVSIKFHLCPDRSLRSRYRLPEGPLN